MTLKKITKKILTDCTHEGKYEICGQIVCPKCYYDMLMNPSPKEVHAFEKNLYGRIIYEYDDGKHMPMPEIVYPNDPRYETGLRTAVGVYEKWKAEHE